MDFGRFWGAVIVILPFVNRMGFVMETRVGRDTFLLVSCLLSVLLYGVNPRVKILLPSIYLIGFAYLVTDNHLGPFYTYQLVFLCVGIVTLASFCTVQFKVNTIHNAMGIACITQSLFVLAQVNEVDLYALFYSFLGLGFEKVTTSPPGTINGALANSTISGAAIAVLTPTLLREGWRKFIPLAAAALIFLGSAMSIAAAVVGAIFYALANDKKSARIVFVVLAITAVGLFIFGFPQVNNFLADNRRHEVWMNGLNLINNIEFLPKLSGKTIVLIPHQLSDFDKVIAMTFGRGVGFFAEKYPALYPSYVDFDHAHNEYLEVYAAFGIVGLALVVSLFWKVFSVDFSKHPIEFGIFMACAANSFGNFTFHISSTALAGIYSISKLIMEESWHFQLPKNKGWLSVTSIWKSGRRTLMASRRVTS